MTDDPCVYCGHARAVHTIDDGECDHLIIRIESHTTGKRTRVVAPSEKYGAHLKIGSALQIGQAVHLHNCVLDDVTLDCKIERIACGCVGWADEPTEAELTAEPSGLGPHRWAGLTKGECYQ